MKDFDFLIDSLSEVIIFQSCQPPDVDTSFDQDTYFISPCCGSLALLTRLNQCWIYHWVKTIYSKRVGHIMVKDLCSFVIWVWVALFDFLHVGLV